MPSIEFKGISYDVDDEDFLTDTSQWDAGFAEGMAPKVGITEGLTGAHWEVIRFIREAFTKTGRCPMVFETCKAHQLHSADLQALFPSGYLRGACKLAGLSYRAEDLHPSWLPDERMVPVSTPLYKRVYRVNVRGFLVDPSDWDEDFAVFKGLEMKMSGPLGAKHWRIIRYLRRQFAETGKVPTVFETCSANQMEIEDLERLFPDGYHRGAVKLAGLRVV
jgi:TusE/DsrC/DsvC family sulfur relay protein